MIRRRLLVSGIVQDVFFRDTCQREARAANVTGWAKNLDDGRVEVMLEGEPEAVAAVEAWCHEGPPAGRVDAVAGFDEPVTGLTGFDVR